MNNNATLVKEQIILCTLLFVLLYKCFNPSNFTNSKFWTRLLSTKVKKRYLVNYYGIDKATFRKWIKYFCSDIFPDIKGYNNRRTLTIHECLQIIKILGIKGKEKLISKKDIILQGEGTYKSLRESINHYPDHFGISKEVYVNLRIFPPNVSKRIVNQYS